jgi:ABC-type Fe3+/spermidine/putrescine transport system ATPase subunit
MDRGRIVQMGPPAEVYAKPANAYAADFVGSANILKDGRIVRREEIEIGSRPIAGGASGRDDIVGVVEGVEFRGAVTGYRIRTDQGVVHVDVWSAQQPRTYQRGEEVRLRLP